MPTVVEILKRTEGWLRDRGCESPRMDAEILLGHALGLKRIQIYMSYDRELEDAEIQSIRPLVRRRGEREPIAYILGNKEFWSMSFAVGPGVLVPRPDTETLVEAALPLCDGETVYVADVCAGSGCVGLAIAKEKPGVKLYATDLSDAALDACAKNAAAHGLERRVAVLRGDLMAPIPAGRPIDVVVSNPPYVRSQEIPELEPEISTWEPREALDGGDDGLSLYRRLVPAAAARARRAVLVEIGHDQGPDVAEIFREAGLRAVQIKRDLGKRDRVVVGYQLGWEPADAPTGQAAPASFDEPVYEPLEAPLPESDEEPVVEPIYEPLPESDEEPVVEPIEDEDEEDAEGE